jgi:hypothetical protein
MPTLSASDYTTYLKFKAAAASPIKPNIQTRDNVSVSQAVINANVLASQAAFVATPSLQVVGSLASVQGVQVVQTRANPNALSTVAGTGTMSSSAIQRPGGLPTGFKGSQGSYTRLPQNAGWIQGNQVSSGPKRF